MIRNVLIVIVFFFGPALVMLMLRALLPLVAGWLRARRAAREVIDVTPRKRALPRWFWPLALMLGAASAAWAWQALDQAGPPAEGRVYVPAHLGKDGRLVPGHWVRAGGGNADGHAPNQAPAGGAATGK